MTARYRNRTAITRRRSGGRPIGRTGPRLHRVWHDMFSSGIPYAEKAIRTVLVYLALLVLLRLVGKRGLAQLNTFDLVVMMLLSNVVQNAVIGNDNSLVGGLFGAAVLLFTDAVLVRQAARWGWSSGRRCCCSPTRCWSARPPAGAGSPG